MKKKNAALHRTKSRAGPKKISTDFFYPILLVLSWNRGNINK